MTAPTLDPAESRTVEPVLEVTDLVKQFPIPGGRVVHAVEKVSFQVAAGETLALVGESGCGKTTLSHTAMRLLKPDGGTIRLGGADISTLSRRQLRPHRSHMQIVFQDPYASLNPRYTIGSAIAEPMKINGWSAERIKARVPELLELVGLPAQHASRYPHQFSGGQRQRICIARALALEPSLVVCDEAVSALDVSVQATVLNLLMELQRELGIAYLFVSHDLAVVERVAHRVAVMYLGQIVESGTRQQVFGNPGHPYTRRLLAAVPVADPTVRKERELQSGEIPSPVWPKGRGPELVRMDEVEPGHLVAAH